MYPIAIHFSLPLWCIITVYSSKKYNLGSNFLANRGRCRITKWRDGPPLVELRYKGRKSFFRVNTVLAQWSQGDPRLSPCSPLPSPLHLRVRTSKFSLWCPSCIAMYQRWLADCHEHILPEAIFSLKLDFSLARSSPSLPLTRAGFL